MLGYAVSTGVGDEGVGVGVQGVCVCACVFVRVSECVCARERERLFGVEGLDPGSGRPGEPKPEGLETILQGHTPFSGLRYAGCVV